MFAKSEKPSLVKAFTELQETGVRGRRFDPVVPMAVGVSALLLSLLKFYENSSSRVHYMKLADEANCPSIGPQTGRCVSIHNRLIDLDSRDRGEKVWIGFFALVFISLVIRGIYIYVNSEPHPHLKIANDFFEKNPSYPEDRETQTIECPILQDTSDKPVSITYDYDKKPCSFVYDYNELISWFKSHKTDPIPNIDLLSDRVTNFKISFDIPEEHLIHSVGMTNS